MKLRRMKLYRSKKCASCFGPPVEQCWCTLLGSGAGVQRSVRSELVVRADGAGIYHSVSRAQPARHCQQRCQLHPVLRRRAEVPSRVSSDVLCSRDGALRQCEPGRRRDARRSMCSTDERSARHSSDSVSSTLDRRRQRALKCYG